MISKAELCIPQFIAVRSQIPIFCAEIGVKRNAVPLILS